MRRFAALVESLDRTTRTTEKVAALADYFRAAPPEDAAWALYVLSGRTVKRAVSSTRLREWMVERAGHPDWLVDEAYSAVGDLAETLALLHPPTPADTTGGTDLPLHRMMEERVVPLRDLEEAEARRTVLHTWSELDAAQRFVWNKLLTGAFRLGVGRKLTVRGLASATGLDPAILAHRVTGRWSPTPDDFARITAPAASETDPGRPYPFFLAHAVDEARGVESLGDREEWQVEWKWDGIRAQLIRRVGEVLVWSRGEELVTPWFPEIADAAGVLPDGHVLDGEVVAWGAEGVRPFAQLQRRLNRKRVGARLLKEVPVRFLAYDLLEAGGQDRRTRSLDERRAALEALMDGIDVPQGHGGAPVLGVSPLVDAPSWPALAALREGARERGVEGLMLKRREGPYRVGRPRGDWWKWKVEPFQVDAVMLYAQRGHGRRASLHSDYTFGVWDGDVLVPIAKAYSGLTDAEIREVDRWVRRHTIERFGPVRSVKPELVFELAFEGIRRSTRHKSGVAVRFPRMVRWRRDKPAEEADTLDAVRALIPRSGEPSAEGEA
ncbi:ATP-dependent DNA ligase [Gaopeijia maritima]|uniref:DNA ligase (ATP) n=1 Tax=Gaopeijia maritima TaxID=3119007 RepID=A0ABU9E6C4_9BACT